MVPRLATRLQAVRNLSWPVLLARTLRHAGVRNGWLDRLDFLNAPDATRPLKAVDILFGAMRSAGLDPQRIVERLPAATVLEIGCGRYIGFAPLSAVAGAKLYIGADPGLKPELFQNRAVLDRIVDPAIAAAAALIERGPVDPAEMLAKCRLERCGVAEALRPDDAVDVCVSVSCLEHIGDLEASIRRVAAASRPGTVHAHLVNFSNHLSKSAPFAHLYETDPSSFERDWGGIVNGFRHPDMAEMFRSAGLDLRFVPLDRVAPDHMPAEIHPYWTERYEDDVLAVRTGLFFSEGLIRYQGVKS